MFELYDISCLQTKYCHLENLLGRGS